MPNIKNPENIDLFIKELRTKLVTPYKDYHPFDSMLDTSEEELEKRIRHGIAVYIENTIEWYLNGPWTHKVKDN